MSGTKAIRTNRQCSLSRFLRAACGAASLLFVAATAAIWARSFQRQETLIWRRQAGDCWVVGTSRGQVLLGHSLHPGIDDRRPFNIAGVSHSSTTPWQYLARLSLDPCRENEAGSFFGLPPPPTHRTLFDKAGFAYQEGLKHSLDSRGAVLSTVVSSRFLLIPCWAIVLAFAAGPAVWVGCRLMHKRRSQFGSGFTVSLTDHDPDPPAASGLKAREASKPGVSCSYP